MGTIELDEFYKLFSPKTRMRVKRARLTSWQPKPSSKPSGSTKPTTKIVNLTGHRVMAKASPEVDLIKGLWGNLGVPNRLEENRGEVEESRKV